MTPPSPFSPSMTVRAARDAYLAENGFDVAEYDADWGSASFLGLELKVPNTARRKRAIRAHDLHHVVTGYGTDHVGEGEISAWELGAGTRSLGPYVTSIVVAGALFGFVIAPRRVVRAFRRGLAARRTLFRDEDLGPLLELRVSELRAALGVAPEGEQTGPRGLHAFAPRLGRRPDEPARP